MAASRANSVLGSKGLEWLWHVGLVSAQWRYSEAYWEALMCLSE